MVFDALRKSFANLEILRTLTNVSLYTGYYRSVKDYIQPLIKVMALSAPVLVWLSDEKKTAVLIGVFYFVAYLLTSLASKHSGSFNKLFKTVSKPLNLSIITGFATAVAVGLFFEYGFYVVSVFGFVVLRSRPMTRQWLLCFQFNRRSNLFLRLLLLLCLGILPMLSHPEYLFLLYPCF